MGHSDAETPQTSALSNAEGKGRADALTTVRNHIGDHAHDPELDLKDALISPDYLSHLLESYF